MGILKNLLGVAASYVPTEWVTGDIITADKLNHMESGIADAGGDGGIMIVNIIPDPEEPDDYMTDKTFAEMFTAFKAGTPIYIWYRKDNNWGWIKAPVIEMKDWGQSGKYLYAIVNPYDGESYRYDTLAIQTYMGYSDDAGMYANTIIEMATVGA